MKPSRTLALLSVSALLQACGGGGSGTDVPAAAAAAPPAPLVLSVPLPTAMPNLVNLTRSGSVTVAGSASSGGQTLNVSGSGSFSEAIAAGTFEGVAGLRKTLSVSGTLVGSSGGQSASVPLNSISDTYFDSNYKPLGSTATGSYCVTTSYTAPPAAAQVGAQADWYAQDCYASGAKTIKLGTLSVKYAIEADSATSVLLKVTTTARANDGTTLPAVSTYRVTAAGAVTHLNDSTLATLQGVTLSLTITYQ